MTSRQKASLLEKSCRMSLFGLFASFQDGFNAGGVEAIAQYLSSPIWTISSLLCMRFMAQPLDYSNLLINNFPVPERRKNHAYLSAAT